MRLQVESVMLFVNAIDSAAACMCHAAEGVSGAREPALCLRTSAAGRGYRAPSGAGAKSPGGVPATMPCWNWPAWMPYWPRSHRRPAAPHFCAHVALMIDPTSNTPGLRQARPRTRRAWREPLLLLAHARVAPELWRMLTSSGADSRDERQVSGPTGT